MDRAESGNRRRVVSVNATIHFYGDRIPERYPLTKPQKDFSETSSRAGELHIAQRDIGRYRERKAAAESVRARAKSVLSNAKKTVKDLSLLIEKSNSKVKPHMRDIEMLREERALAVMNIGSYQYADVLRELEFVRQELCKLKLDMAYVLEEKSRTEKEVQDSSSKMFSYLSSAQGLTKDIEKANKEQVLVELARIEALKEFREIEAQRVKEANEFSAAMEKTKQKIEEIHQSKELETKLAVTLSDVDVLQSELKLLKQMDKKVQRNDNLNRGSSREGEELMGASPLLQPVIEELEAAKKELALVREEGFQFTASMDIIRNELKHVTEETVRLKKTEVKAGLTAENLSSKLLRSNAKLEAVSAAEEKDKSISSNLSHILEQLKTEAETAGKEKELITAETATIKAEILKTESEIDITEERLQVAVEELEVVKSSEALALENLRTLAENTMRARASASQHSSKITISKFEYDYLTGRASGAEEIADKKVAAAHAWIEALKGSEKEILIKTELAQRKIREMSLVEETDAYRTDESLSAKRIGEGGLQNWRQKREKNVETVEAENLQLALLPKSMKDNGNMTPSGGAKFQKSASRKAASPAARHINSFTIKKKKKATPNLAKLFSGKRIDRDR